ncbi:cell surface protein SprA [Flavobacterium sp.]|uniref:T9SS outer membrane translocon Sov/SprA n=1 Tax=Flavobacterium sp. TaxID=239 RepID=UPI0025B94F57|nr:cell surface protein SprA [Flavobacterium sp.]
MKTDYNLTKITFNKFLFFWLLLAGFSVEAQVDEEDDTPKDTIGYNQGSMQLPNPPSIVDAYTYDPVTNKYVYSSKVDDFNINYPIILTPEEYQELVQREAVRKYFREKSDAIEGKNEEGKKDLLPRYYVNSGFFETIFGSNTIDVKPTGSVEMDLGIRYTKTDNPSLSPRNRQSTVFDFDQRISMSLMGKVGTRLNVTANYDTESTFAFQNLIKLEYTPTEDDIIQKIEVGNVSMPLTSALIRGPQSLFGVKTVLQFGKTTVTGVFSEQKSQTRTVTAQGGGTLQDFEMFALDYDADRHYFLSQYFRNNYDNALEKYPLINSRVQITRIEVWVTNRQNRVNTVNNNMRNIVALQDLGEARIAGQADADVVAINPVPGTFFLNPVGSPPDNDNNQYDPALIGTGGLLNSNIREIVTASTGFNNTVSEGRDYSKLENARKLTEGTEFTYHPQLGYVSLQQRLSNDEVLAVAYQYTIGGTVYQVGEFGTDGVEATNATTDPNTGQVSSVSTQALILKMLRSSLTNVNLPVWDLMMKNVYQIPGAYQLEQEDFRFNILYTDPSPLNYITPVVGTTFPNNPDAPVAETPLLKVFNLDRLNYNNDPQVGGDGFFDYYPTQTVDPQYGRIIFTTVEPFGKLLFEKLRTSTTQNYEGDQASLIDFNENQRKYVFKRMYRDTQAQALQESDKNKFQLKGRFKSTGGDGIPIGAYNVPQGSVVVSAGGRILVEGVDYSVNYQLGRVQILDPSLQNQPVEVSVENNSVFGQQTRRFWGFNVEHKISDKIQLNANYWRLTERPFTQKSNYGQESVNNSIFGVGGTYASELPFLTRWVNKLPNIDTDVPSNISVRGEVAFLKPDTPKADRFNGESTIYIDDFEGSQTTIDLRGALSWFLSSTPANNATSPYDFFQNASTQSLQSGYRRAKLSWYSIDPIFYAQRPAGVSQQDISYNSTRRIYSEELYPNVDIAVGQSTVVNTLDLTYYPNERGPYNYNPEVAGGGAFVEPRNNFGGIMRALNSTNFEQGNVEYIQFWMLDPYYDPGNPDAATPGANTGSLYLNLGAISEDILKDGRKQFENGLGPGSVLVPTVWGNVPGSQSLIYAYDADGANRSAQDIGLDGLSDAEEAAKFPAFADLADPSGDNYRYYLNAQGNILERYRDYNGTQGNSPTGVSDTNRGSTTLPDIDDINRDNTMNEINAYYEYRINLRPGMEIGTDPYLVDIRDTPASQLPSGTNATSARWLLFKIPVDQYVNNIGDLADFKTIQFMRMFLTGFQSPLTVRFGALDLVRGEWRRYTSSLELSDPTVDDDNTNFDVQALNIQENTTRCPVNYVSPPGVSREQLYQNQTVINQNEQSLALRIDGQGGLEPGINQSTGDARAVFKNVSVDMRQFKKLKMFLHAESLAADLESEKLRDNEMIAFIRFGNDFTQNYYEVQIPLKVTPYTYNPAGGNTNCASIADDIVWPEANEMDLSLELLTKLKVMMLNGTAPEPDENGVRFINEGELNAALAGRENELRLGIKGNPNFGLVRTLMIGIKNNTRNPLIPTAGTTASNRPIRGEVWFNELRMAEMDNQGGWAGVLNMDANVADFATISAVGRMSTIGFGSLEQGPNERSREDQRQYNIVTNVNLGKLLPKKWAVNLPFNYAVGEEIITPQYDPFYQDIKLDQLLENTEGAAAKKNVENRAVDYTKRTSINFIGVRKERAAEKKPHLWDPENLTLSYSYNQVDRHSYEIENYLDQQVSATADYAYSFQSKPIEPFKKSKFFKKSDYWKLLSDFNFNYLPSNITFNTNILRQYNKQLFRQVDVEGIPLDALYQRNYLFNYQYGFNFPLTKALKINYNVTSSHIIRNYINEQDVPDNTITVWDDFFDVGIPNQHSQQLVVNYDLPINKIPALAFIKSTYSYTGDYSWQRASFAMQEVEATDGTIYNLGNTVQNAASHKLNTAFNMDALYKYIGLGKKTPKAPARPAGPPKPGEKIQNAAQPAQAGRGVFLDGLIGVLTSVKNIQVNYTDNRGTVLPGYLPDVGFFGSSKPSLGFVFGSQEDVRYEAAKRGWLTQYPDFNQNYTEVVNKTLDFTANVDLFPDLKIDLTANRTYANNYSEQYDVGDNPLTSQIEDDYYNQRSPYDFGNFSISTVMLKTSFKKSDENFSSAFQDFRENRLIIANRLAVQHYGSTSFPIGADGYPVGFGKNNQAVLLPSFLAAYTGLGIGKSGYGESAKDISLSAFRDIPIPNWTIKYNGLMRYKFFKDTFKRFSLQSAYRASYTLNSFRSNFEYDPVTNPTDLSGNFQNKTIISNANLVEQFNPLMRVDFEMKNSFKFLAEMKKDRAMSLSFDNNLLTEVMGKEFVLGLGYRFKDVIFSTRLADNPQGIIKSDINVKIDGSYRNNKTIVRNLDYDNNQLGGGQNIWSAKLTADYSFSKNLTLIFYYDHQFSKAVISTSYPMTNIRGGFTLRYNFGN